MDVYPLAAVDDVLPVPRDDLRVNLRHDHVQMDRSTPPAPDGKDILEVLACFLVLSAHALQKLLDVFLHRLAVRCCPCRVGQRRPQIPWMKILRIPQQSPHLPCCFLALPADLLLRRRPLSFCPLPLFLRPQSPVDVLLHFYHIAQVNYFLLISHLVPSPLFFSFQGLPHHAWFSKQYV